jgi:hypothetical protein
MTRVIGLGGTLFLLGALTLPAEAGGSSGTERLSPLALSPAEQTAVVADSEGALHLVRAGEALPSGAGRLVEVLTDRLVVDLLPGSPPEAGGDGAGGRPTVPLRVWIYPPERPGMPARVQELDRMPPNGLLAELLIVPETVPERLPEGARIARPPAPPPEADDDPDSPPESDETGGSGSAGDSSVSGSTTAAPRRETAAGSDQ